MPEEVPQYGQATAWIAISTVEILFLDTFSRTTSAPPFDVGSPDIGSDWQWVNADTMFNEGTSQIHVDGSELVTSGGVTYDSMMGPPTIDAGEVQWDFWVQGSGDNSANIRWEDVNWWAGYQASSDSYFTLLGQLNPSDNWPVTRNAWHRFRVVVNNIDSDGIYVKGHLWKIGDPEPDTWTTIQNVWPTTYYSPGTYSVPIWDFWYTSSSPDKYDNLQITNLGTYILYNQGFGQSLADILSFNMGSGQALASIDQAQQAAQAQAQISPFPWWQPSWESSYELIPRDYISIGPQDLSVGFPSGSADSGTFYQGFLRVTFIQDIGYAWFDTYDVNSSEYRGSISIYTDETYSTYVNNYGPFSAGTYYLLGTAYDYSSSLISLRIGSNDFPLLAAWTYGSASFSIDSPIKNQYAYTQGYLRSFDQPVFGQSQADILSPNWAYGQAQARITPYPQLPNFGLYVNYNNVSSEVVNYRGWPNFPSPSMPINAEWWAYGSFIADITGTWQFQIVADYRSVLYIDGTPILDVYYYNGAINTTIDFVQGDLHTIELYWYGDSAINGLQVWYQRPDDTDWWFLTDNNPPWTPTYLGLMVYAQALSQIYAFGVPQYGQALALIGSVYQGQAQADILATTYNFAQAQTLIFNYAVYAQTQSDIKQTYPNDLTGTSGTIRVRPISDVDESSSGMVLSSGTTGWTLVGGNTVNLGNWYIAGYPSGYISHQFSAPDMPVAAGYSIDSVTITAYVQCYAPSFGGIIQSRDPSTGIRYDVFGGGQGDVGYFSGTLTTRPWDSQPWTLDDINDLQFGDAEGYDYDGYQGYRVFQLYADIAWSFPTNAPFAQANAQILGIVPNFAQAQTFIKSQFVFAQTQAHIKSTVCAYAQVIFFVGHFKFGQVQTDIKATEYSFSQTQAFVGHFQSGNASVLVRTTNNNKTSQTAAKIVHSSGFGITRTSIRQFNIKGYGQSRVQVGYWKFGLARCYVVKTKEFSQAQADILRSDNYQLAQAAVYIPIPPSGQAQADIIQTYTQSSNAGAILNTGLETAATQADILQVYQQYAIMQSDIKQTYSPLAQVQADIRIRYYLNFQAGATLSRQYRVYSQSMVWIGYHEFSQTQAQIASFNVPKFGLAGGYISTTYIPPGPSSNYQTYLVRFNGYDLPGYAQSESYTDALNIIQYPEDFIDGSYSADNGLKNIDITIEMLVWEKTYTMCKDKVRLAATIMRSARGFAPLYIQRRDEYYSAIAKSLTVSKQVPDSPQILKYTIVFETRPQKVT
jgi:hypothetical protein